MPLLSPATGWPVWKNTLPPNPTPGARRAEGGRRLQGYTSQSNPDAPLISYVTVVRNGERTLARTLKSVQQQRHPNVEHIVLDGASTDGTLSIIEQHSSQIDYYASEPDAGLYPALNKAIELARGDLICILNADDWLTTDAAEIAAETLRQHDSAAPLLLLTAAWVVPPRNNKQLWRPENVDLGCYLSCANACHNAIYATRRAYELSGPYSTHLPIAADFRWVMSCVDANVTVVRENRPTTFYALGGLSSDTDRHSHECVQIIHERFPSLSQAQAWGLYHCFHTFRERPGRYPNSAPAHKGRFLRDLTRQHQQQYDLLAAIALAGMEIMRHPLDLHPTNKMSRPEKLKRSIDKRLAQLRMLLARL